MRDLFILTIAFVLVVSATGFLPIARAADGCTSLGAGCILPTTGGPGVCVRGEIELVCGLGIQQTPVPTTIKPQTQTPAVTTNPGSNITLINPLNSGNCAPNGACLMNFLNKILDFVIEIGTVVVVLMMVYVGFLFVAARGEPAKLTTARSALLWTVVGALILLGSKAISISIGATVRALGG